MQILTGIGGKLQEPCLLQGQELNGGRIKRLFAQKILWLRPVSDIPNTFFSEETFQLLIIDLLPVYICHMLLLEYFIKSKLKSFSQFGSSERPRHFLAIELHSCLAQYKCFSNIERKFIVILIYRFSFIWSNIGVYTSPGSWNSWAMSHTMFVYIIAQMMRIFHFNFRTWSFTRIEWPSGLRQCNQYQKVPSSIHTRCLARLWDLTLLWGFWWVRLSPQKIPKLNRGAAKQKLKKSYAFKISLFLVGYRPYFTFSICPSVPPSVVHHISGTVHYLIIIFGTNV